MKKSRVFTLGLACFLTAITAFGVAPITSGGGVFGDNYAGSSLSVSPLNSSEKAIHDAAILSGGDLGLDPENDPVVWVTDNGFEIKSHDVAVSSGTITVSSISWKYVTLGSWNWIIIGYSTKSLNQSKSGYVNINNTSYNDYFSITDMTNIVNKLGTDSTPAGSTIKSECVTNNDQIYLSGVSVPTKFKTIFTNAAADPANEIPAGCVLCLCAGTTGNSYFNNTRYPDAYYLAGELKTAITTVYNNIKSAAGNAIQSTPLTTYGYNGSKFTTYPHSEYLFPLASGQSDGQSSENFCVRTYLDSKGKRSCNEVWWLRTGHPTHSDDAYYVDRLGDTDTGSVQGSIGVRPAFVLKLY